MSTIDSGHCEALYEQAEEAILGGWRGAGDLRAGDDAGDVGCAGCATLCGEREPHFQMVEGPTALPAVVSLVQGLLV